MKPLLDDADFTAVLRWLHQRTGLTFRPDQYRATRAAIVRVMRRLGVQQLDGIQLALAQNPRAMAELINELTVGETYFFREPKHFCFIRDHIFPEIEARLGPTHRLRAWSAGCASGEEAYSLAMVAMQCGLESRIRLLATDLSEAALAKARRAVYRQWSFRIEASEIMKSVMIQRGDEFELCPTIRQLVDFRPLNLASEDYPSIRNGTSNVDLILCRNVLIYFQRESVARIAHQLYASLAPGGWLITSSADPLLNENVHFEVITNDAGTFYRRPLTSVASSKSDTQRRASVPSTQLPEPVVEKPPRLSAASRFTLLQPTSTRTSQPLVRQNPNDGIDLCSNLAAAVEALQGGDCQRAAQLTERFPDDPRACIIHVQALAAIAPETAVERCQRASQRHSLEPELHYRLALLMADANRNLEAIQAAQKVLFLERSSVMGHFLLGSLHLQQGQLKSARKHFLNVCELCASRRPGEVPVWSSGETIADLATSAEAQLTRLSGFSEP